MEETLNSLGKNGALKLLYEKSGFRKCCNPWFECHEGYAVTSGAVLLEGIDFDLTFFPLKHLGYKAVLEATGELLSAMSSPKVLKITIGVSSKIDFPEIKQLWEGIVSAAREFSYLDVALDLVPSLTGLSISVAASGLDCNKPQKRPVASSMDLICISNNPGASFLGERILQSSKTLDEDSRQKKLERYKQLIGAYLKPELSPAVLEALKDSDIMPSFAYFCKDSLSAVVRRLCEDSGLGAKIYVDKIPLAGGSVDAAGELGLDPLQAALKGGEDCCLLFTIPIGSHERFRRDFQSWDIIGHLAKPEVGAVLVSPDGLEHEL